MYFYLDDNQLQLLGNILALTSIENDDVRNLRQYLRKPPELEKILLEDGGTVLRCPHCGQEFAAYTSEELEDFDYDDVPAILVIDMDIRDSRFVWDGTNITGYYSDYGVEWNTNHYECSECGKRVSLPKNVLEDGIS
jgi:DNA-directed RNA polymerase subunit RPC12/RpoP